MKTMLLAAAVAAFSLLTAGAASAEHDRGGGYYRNAEITVRDHGHVMRFDRRDRLFYRLLESPFRFRPGYTYVYTDQCRRDGQCRVLVFAPWERRPVDSLHAPPLNRRGYWRDRSRWDDDWDDDDWDDDRDGRWRRRD